MRSLVVLALLIAGTAHADDKPWQPRFGVAGQLGIGAPLGIIGVQGDYAPLRWLSIDAGIGRGVEGIQLATNARVRPLRLSRRAAITFSIGGSMGAYRWFEDLIGGHGETEKVWNRAYWINGDIGLEVGDQAGWFYRFYLGYGRILNPDDFQCEPSDTVAHCMNDHADDGKSLRYFGIVVGHSI